MDQAELLVTLGGAVLIVLTLWFFLGGRRSPSGPMATGAVYACPMHPWITGSEPAACPECGMALVRRRAG